MTQVVPFQQDDSKDNHAAAGVLSLKNMDPDFDGDGKVSASERDVYDRMIAADTDRDGHLTRKEVYQVIAKLKGEIDEAKGGIPRGDRLRCPGNRASASTARGAQPPPDERSGAGTARSPSEPRSPPLGP